MFQTLHKCFKHCINVSDMVKSNELVNAYYFLYLKARSDSGHRGHCQSESGQRQWPPRPLSKLRQKSFLTKEKGVKHLGNWPQTFMFALLIAGGFCSLHALIFSTFTVFKRFVVTAFRHLNSWQRQARGNWSPHRLLYLSMKRRMRKSFSSLGIPFITEAFR